MTVAFQKPLEFPHKMKHDGTILSICPHCHFLVGMSTWEAELERIEASHVCAGRRDWPVAGHAAIGSNPQFAPKV